MAIATGIDRISGNQASCPNDVAPAGLHRAGHAEHRGDDEPEDVGGDGEGEDQRPRQERRGPGKSWAPTSHASPTPSTIVDGADAGHQHERRDDLAGQPRRPLLAPHLGVRPQDAAEDGRPPGRPRAGRRRRRSTSTRPATRGRSGRRRTPADDRSAYRRALPHSPSSAGTGSTRTGFLFRGDGVEDDGCGAPGCADGVAGVDCAPGVVQVPC